VKEEREKRKKNLKKEQRKSEKMAEEQAPIPRFSGDEDDFCALFLQAKAYALSFGYTDLMDVAAKADLPAVQGPGVGAAQQGAVGRNMKAAAFLTLAMPDSIVINVMAAGLAKCRLANPAKSSFHGGISQGVL
jgi:hypothetical protein